MPEEKKHEKIIDIAKRRGIIYPSFEIYGGLSGFYDYGPIGTRIKKNFEEMLRKAYLIDENCYEIECPTLSPEEVWIASGHVKNFSDYITNCTKCNEPYRADHLIEEILKISCDGKTIEELNELIEKNNIRCKKCNERLGKVYNYNLMFPTDVGPGKYKKRSYLRPETAQTTFLAFKRLWETARKKLPIGVLQIGHSYRNEISPRQYMIRLREFTQAEIEFFIDPEETEKDERYNLNTQKSWEKIKIKDKNENTYEISIKEAYEKKIIKNKIIAYFIIKSIEIFSRAGISKENLVLRQHRDNERAFYSKDTWDIEYISDIGRVEIVGIADRGDYDLKQHQEKSKESMEISYNNKKFIPNVVEVAYGIDRPVYCILESCYTEDNENQRTYFKLPKEISPYIGIFPLVKKDGIPEKAHEIVNILKKTGLYLFYDDAGSIGRRYARADEVGAYYSITIDYQTLEDSTVTVRLRDDKSQIRVKIDKLKEYLTS